MLHFGAILSATFFRGNTPIRVRSRNRRRRIEVRKAKEVHPDWGKQDTGVTSVEVPPLTSVEVPSLTSVKVLSIVFS